MISVFVTFRFSLYLGYFKSSIIPGNVKFSKYIIQNSNLFSDTIVDGTERIHQNQIFPIKLRQSKCQQQHLKERDGQELLLQQTECPLKLRSNIKAVHPQNQILTVQAQINPDQHLQQVSFYMAIKMKVKEGHLHPLQ